MIVLIPYVKTRALIIPADGKVGLGVGRGAINGSVKVLQMDQAAGPETATGVLDFRQRGVGPGLVPRSVGE